MSNRFVEVSHQGFLSRLGNSIMGVLFGILLFFGSFIVLFKNEGRTDYSKLAEKAGTADSAKTGGTGFVSVTGPLTSAESLGDPKFLKPGAYLQLQRTVEMYAWIETKKSTDKKTLGGGKTTETTYEYKQEWTRDANDGAKFKYPSEHRNPPLRWSSQTFTVRSALVGVWSFETDGVSLPGSTKITPALENLSPDADATLYPVGDYYYLRNGAESDPALGDIRLSYSGVVAGNTVTVFGDAKGSELTRHDWGNGTVSLKVYSGTRAQALATMKSEYKMLGWILRVVGFLMMWFGLMMLFGPLQAIADVIPFVGNATGFIVGVITFPIALILTTAFVLIAMVLHSLWAMVILGALVLGYFLLRRSRKQAARS